jgi:phosphatidylglycerophosphate synthase
MATMAMFFWGLSGAFFFSFGLSHCYIYGGICFVLLIISDTVDGELARYNGTSSLFGDYLDRLAHYVTNSAMILGLGIGLYLTYETIIIFYISTFILICYLFDDISRDLLISCGLAESNSRKEGKEELSIINGSIFKRYVAYTASNTAFMHIVILIALLDIFYEFELLLIHLYIGYFYSLSIIKVLYRIPKIISLKNKY